VVHPPFCPCVALNSAQFAERRGYVDTADAPVLHSFTERKVTRHVFKVPELSAHEIGCACSGEIDDLLDSERVVGHIVLGLFSREQPPLAIFDCLLLELDNLMELPVRVTHEPQIIVVEVAFHDPEVFNRQGQQLDLRLSADRELPNKLVLVSVPIFQEVGVTIL